MSTYTLVTGGSRGIGRAIVLKLIERDHHVIYLSRSEGEKLDNSTHIENDLCNLEQTQNNVKKLLATYNISNLICNAGVGAFGSLENFSKEQIQNSIQLNLTSPLLVSRLSLPALKSHSRSNLVFIGSESALLGGRYGSVYSAAKFGLRGAAQSLKHECASSNCHVGIVNPGMVRTDFFKHLNFQPGDEKSMALKAEDVANAVMTLIDAPDHAHIDEINVNPVKRVVYKKSQN